MWVAPSPHTALETRSSRAPSRKRSRRSGPRRAGGGCPHRCRDEPTFELWSNAAASVVTSCTVWRTVALPPPFAGRTSCRSRHAMRSTWAESPQCRCRRGASALPVGWQRAQGKRGTRASTRSCAGRVDRSPEPMRALRSRSRNRRLRRSSAPAGSADSRSVERSLRQHRVSVTRWPTRWAGCKQVYRWLSTTESTPRTTDRARLPARHGIGARPPEGRAGTAQSAL